MKALAWGIGGLGLIILVAGCQPELARVQYGDEEQQWERFVDRSYSGFKPPRTAPPAIADKFSPKADEGVAPNDKNSNKAVVPPADAEPSAETESVANNVSPTASETAKVAPESQPEEKPVTTVPEVTNAQTVATTPESTSEPSATSATEVANDQTVAPSQNPATESPLNEDGTYTVKYGDTLSYISAKVYKDGRKYELIIKANPDIRKNPNYLKPGMKLTIPQL